MKQPRILILLDGSASMLQPWNTSDSRFTTAGRIVTTLMDSIYKVNNQVEFALRVYGHQSPVQDNNCYDTRREVMFSKDNLTQMYLRLHSLHPAGVSPIAYSLKEAAENDLVDEQHNAYTIILITDGGESCNGNICEVAKMLLEKKIFFRPYILSLVDYTPLRQQYDCLGSYLQVANEKDITPTVNTIVSAYRTALTLPTIVSKPIQVTNTPPPAPAPVKVIPQPVVIKRDTPVPLPVVVKKDTPTVKPAPSPVVRYEVKLQISPIAAAIPNRTLPVRFATASLKKLPIPNIKVKPVKPDPDTITITYNKPVTQTPPVQTPPPPKPKPKPQPQPVVKPAQPVVNNTPVDKPRQMAYTRETEDAKETTVSIYFTDGHGKFYQSTPQLQLNDLKGNPVQKFYRTIDAGGIPDPQKVPAGTYDITALGKSRMLMQNVVIEEHKNNKIIVKVPSGTLKFAYIDNPDKPVKEYFAVVQRRFEPGPTVKQRCDSELEYEPGNYYVEINTFPPLRRNLDIDFGSETEIRIDEPGQLQITNTNSVAKVTLYRKVGDKFIPLSNLNVTGNLAAQKLELVPDIYEIHYVKNPNVPFAEETVVRVYVYSKKTTDLMLQ
jgi:hypothetical protein